MSETSTGDDHPDCAILWLGDSRRAEFVPAWELLNSSSAVTTYPGWSAADLPGDDLAPALILVAQGSPGEFVEADVVRLRRRYPTAALVRIVGSWCEGELRTSPPPGAVRRYGWHQAAQLLRVDLHRLAAGEGPDWARPGTATDEELLLAAAHLPPPKRHSPLRVGIAATDPFTEQLLHDFCDSDKRYSHAPLHASPQVILWDVPFGEAEQDRSCRQLATQHPAAKLIALASFPRRDQATRLRGWGAAAVVGKPASNACLAATIDALT